MLWLKAFHVVFVVTWFAGLFYLPRLLIHHVDDDNPAARARLSIMERRLLVMMHIGGALAVTFGLLTLWAFARLDLAYLRQGWLHAKLALVLVLIVYHLVLTRLAHQSIRGTLHRSSRWLRIFNEIPGVLLIAIVVLAVVKPDWVG